MKNLSLLLLISSIALSLSDPCFEYPDAYYDKLEYCNRKTTTTERPYCCLLDYDRHEGSPTDKGTACISLTNDEYKNRDLAIEKLKDIYKRAEGTIICDGDSTSSSSSAPNNSPSTSSRSSSTPSSSSSTFINQAKILLSLILLLI